jgi:hypothetical protein
MTASPCGGRQAGRQCARHTRRLGAGSAAAQAECARARRLQQLRQPAIHPGRTHPSQPPGPQPSASHASGAPAPRTCFPSLRACLSLVTHCAWGSASCGRLSSTNMTIDALMKGEMPRSNREAGSSLAWPYSALMSSSPAGGGCGGGCGGLSRQHEGAQLGVREARAAAWRRRAAGGGAGALAVQAAPRPRPPRPRPPRPRPPTLASDRVDDGQVRHVDAWQRDEVAHADDDQHQQRDQGARDDVLVPHQRVALQRLPGALQQPLQAPARQARPPAGVGAAGGAGSGARAPAGGRRSGRRRPGSRLAHLVARRPSAPSDADATAASPRRASLRRWRMALRSGAGCRHAGCRCRELVLGSQPAGRWTEQVCAQASGTAACWRSGGSSRAPTISCAACG